MSAVASFQSVSVWVAAFAVAALCLNALGLSKLLEFRIAERNRRALVPVPVRTRPERRR